METIRTVTTFLFSGALAPFGGHPAMLSLVPLGLVMGAATLLFVKWTSNQDAIRATKARLSAYLYEMRLFPDEPLLIWKAQMGLLAANARYLGMMLVPVLAMAVPMVPIFAELECFYGHAPLARGQEAIVTMQMKAGGGQGSAAPALLAPAGFAVESPAIQIEGDRQFSWRIRALRAASGDMRFVFPGQTAGSAITKSVEAGAGPSYLSTRRVSSALDLVLYPAESRLPQGGIEWIEIRYPEATVHALGLDLHWLIWLFLLSMVSALILKKRFKVAF